MIHIDIHRWILQYVADAVEEGMMGIWTRWTGRTLRRSAQLSVLTLAASAGLVVVAAAPARADWVRCGDLLDREWELVPPHGMSTFTWESYDYLSFNSIPTFNVSDTRIAVNDLDDPATVTFTSQQSRTWSIEVSASMTKSLTKKLSLTVSARVQYSWTTAVGVSVTATVPPHSGVRGDYGTQAFDVTFEARTYRKMMRMTGHPPTPSHTCYDLGVKTYHINAPTDLEGWRVGPL
jgi:hypothetical protein